MRYQLKANEEHYDEAIRTASKQVMAVFESVANPTQLAYNEEYIQLSRLITRLESLGAEPLRLAMIDGWLNELKQRADLFESIRRQQTNAMDKTANGASKKARTDLIEAHRELIDIINALLVIKPTPTLIKFATNLEATNDQERKALKANESLEKKRDDKTDQGLEEGAVADSLIT